MWPEHVTLDTSLIRWMLVQKQTASHLGCQAFLFRGSNLQSNARSNPLFGCSPPAWEVRCEGTRLTFDRCNSCPGTEASCRMGTPVSPMIGLGIACRSPERICLVTSLCIQGTIKLCFHWVVLLYALFSKPDAIYLSRAFFTINSVAW